MGADSRHQWFLEKMTVGIGYYSQQYFETVVCGQVIMLAILKQGSYAVIKSHKNDN